MAIGVTELSELGTQAQGATKFGSEPTVVGGVRIASEPEEGKR